MKKIVACFLCVVLLMVSIPTTAFADNCIDKDLAINALLEQRDKASVSLSLNQELGLNISELVSEIDNINFQLSQLGVQSLTQQEVLERFGYSDEIISYATQPSSNTVN